MSELPPAPKPRRDSFFPPPATRKQKRLADIAIEHPDWSDAQIAEAAGFSTAANARRSLDKPQVRLYMSAILDKAGATREASAKAIADAHVAETTKQFQFKGDVIEADPLIDHQTRLKAAELNLKVRGELQPDNQLIVNQFMQFSDEDLAAIATGQAKVADFIDVTPGLEK